MHLAHHSRGRPVAVLPQTDKGYKSKLAEPVIICLDTVRGANPSSWGSGDFRTARVAS